MDMLDLISEDIFKPYNEVKRLLGLCNSTLSMDKREYKVINVCSTPRSCSDVLWFDKRESSVYGLIATFNNKLYYINTEYATVICASLLSEYGCLSDKLYWGMYNNDAVFYYDNVYTFNSLVGYNSFRVACLSYIEFIGYTKEVSCREIEVYIVGIYSKEIIDDRDIPSSYLLVRNRHEMNELYRKHTAYYRMRIDRNSYRRVEEVYKELISIMK